MSYQWDPIARLEWAHEAGCSCGGSASIVAGGLARCVNSRTGSWSPSKTFLAPSMSSATFAKAIRSLESNGFISVIRVHGKRNEYRLRYPEDAFRNETTSEIEPLQKLKQGALDFKGPPLQKLKQGALDSKDKPRKDQGSTKETNQGNTPQPPEGERNSASPSKEEEEEVGVGIDHPDQLNLMDDPEVNPHRQSNQVPTERPKSKRRSGKYPKDESDKEWPVWVDFTSWWDRYPRKVGKPTAWKSWRTMAEEDREACLDFVDDFAKSVAGKESQFIPHPSTYLNQERYNDEIELSDIERGSNSEPSNEPRLGPHGLPVDETGMEYTLVSMREIWDSDPEMVGDARELVEKRFAEMFPDKTIDTPMSKRYYYEE